jgi:hypothetical protein
VTVVRRDVGRVLLQSPVRETPGPA